MKIKITNIKTGKFTNMQKYKISEQPMDQRRPQMSNNITITSSQDQTYLQLNFKKMNPNNQLKTC